MVHKTNCQLVHEALRKGECTRHELRELLNLSESQVDSALSILLKGKAIHANGIKGHRTYVAVTAQAYTDKRGKSSGSRAGMANLDKSPKRAKTDPVMYPDEWPRQIYGGQPPRPVLRHPLDRAWHPVFPIQHKTRKL